MEWRTATGRPFRPEARYYDVKVPYVDAAVLPHWLWDEHADEIDDPP